MDGLGPELPDDSSKADRIAAVSHGQESEEGAALPDPPDPDPLSLFDFGFDDSGSFDDDSPASGDDSPASADAFFL